MGSNLYTRAGDTGQTSLFDGTKVSKADLRVEAYGTIDEANSWVGLARSKCADASLDGILEFLSHRFYNCSSNVAASTGTARHGVGVADGDVLFLERAIDQLDGKAGPILGFILPGGSEACATLHVARTVCRRAERLLCALAQEGEVDPLVLRFVNRSSDLLFAAARYAAKVGAGGDDVLWDQGFAMPSLED